MSGSPQVESSADKLTVSRKLAWYSCAVAAALACVVLLPLLGHRSLAMWDEGIYAEISREMLGRNPLVPTWNYQPWFEKPPLLFWITAAFFRVFGVTEFWARAASAFSGVATVALLHRFVAGRFGLVGAWCSSVILLSTFGYLHVCRAGEADAMLALAELAAVFGLVLVDEQRGSGWFLYWLGFAAAAMTKGAASVVLLLTLIAVAALERWGAKRFGRAFFGGLGLFLAAVLPWHIAMWHRFGEAFTSQYFGLHVLARASSQIEGHHTHWWYYIVVLLVSAPPWVLVYVPAIVLVFRDPALRSLRVLAAFALVVFVFFTAVQTRLPHYIAPVYPAFSAITGVLVAHWFQKAWTRWRTAASRAGFILAVGALWAVTIAITARARKELHSPRMSNGVVTPDTHEPAALLKHAFRSARGEQPPLLLLAEPPIAPITTALFYSRGPVQQVESFPVVPQPAPDKYTWNPSPLSTQIGGEPRLLLVERSEIARLPSQVKFAPLDSSAHWQLGTVVRRSGQP